MCKIESFNQDPEYTLAMCIYISHTVGHHLAISLDLFKAKNEQLKYYKSATIIWYHFTLPIVIACRDAGVSDNIFSVQSRRW